jgi:poly(hydroxyalkanoate) depolymerase family esterase
MPQKPSPQAPLFVVLHGCLSDAQEAEKSTRMSELGEQHGFYAYYPEPQLGEESKGCFDFYSREGQTPGGSDGAAIVKKVQALTQNHDIDPKKVFVVGMSGGASLVSVLTSCYPEVFAGAAIHSGMGYGHSEDWKDALLIAQTGPKLNRERNQQCRPQSFNGKVFLIHGSMDSIMNAKHFFALKDDYLNNLTPQVRQIPPTLTRFGYRSEVYWVKGEAKGQTLYVSGMGHDWSGAQPRNPLSPRGPDVSPMIVNFFLNRDIGIRAN